MLEAVTVWDVLADVLPVEVPVAVSDDVAVEVTVVSLQPVHIAGQVSRTLKPSVMVPQRDTKNSRSQIAGSDLPKHRRMTVVVCVLVAVDVCVTEADVVSVTVALVVTVEVCVAEGEDVAVDVSVEYAVLDTENVAVVVPVDVTVVVPVVVAVAAQPQWPWQRSAIVMEPTSTVLHAASLVAMSLHRSSSALPLQIFAPDGEAVLCAKIPSTMTARMHATTKVGENILPLGVAGWCATCKIKWVRSRLPGVLSMPWHGSQSARHEARPRRHSNPEKGCGCGLGSSTGWWWAGWVAAVTHQQQSRKADPSNPRANCSRAHH